MISDRTYKKYKQLVAREPVGILHILSGTLLLTNPHNTGKGSESNCMLATHQYFRFPFQKTMDNSSFPLSFRTIASARSYLGMVLDNPIKSGYIFYIPDEVLSNPTEQNLSYFRNVLFSSRPATKITRDVTEFDFIPLEYDYSMRFQTAHKLTKNELANKIYLYEEARRIDANVRLV